MRGRSALATRSCLPKPTVCLDPACDRANRFVKPELADPGAEGDVIPRFLRLVGGKG